MHRAALAFDAASLFAIKLGQDRLRRHALHHRLDVIPVGCYDHIRGLKRHYRPDSDGLLADVKMAKAADRSHPINLGAFLFETSSEYHLIQHLSEKLLI